MKKCKSEVQAMRVLSLFDGISCGQVALERAGIPIEVYYASEIDKYAIQITQKNYPNTIQLGDVEKIDFTQYEGKIDLLIGGSPCTNLSICGNRKGLEGDESRLFWEYVRAIKECKPKYFLLENVESMSDKDKEIISQELGCYPIMINSSLVSAQNRKRYYWFNWGLMQYNLFGFPTCDIPQPEDKGILLKDILESGLSYQEKSDCLTARYQGATFPHDYFRNQRTQVAEPICVNSQSGRGDNPNAQPSIQDRIYNIEGKSTRLTTCFLPNIAEPVIYQLPRGYNDGGIKKDKSPALTTSQWQYNNLLVDIANKNNGEMPKMFSLYNKQIVEDKSPTVTAHSNVSLTNCGSFGIFSPIRLSEYEKSQGQAQRVYSVRGKSVALNANGVGQGGKTGLYKIDLPDGDYIIRKLTPIECERLQTLPEVKNYVIIDFEEESISWFLDRQNINAQFVEKKCHKLQKLVGNAEKLDLNEFVQFVEKNLNIKSQQTKEPVALNVRINCEGLSKAKDFQEKSKKSVNIAEKNLKFLLQKIMQDFALMIVGQNLIQKNETIFGREELLPNEKNFVLVNCGKKELSKCGKEIMQLVKDAENDTLTTKKLMKFITLYPFQKKNIEQNLIIFYYFVQLVISGFTQKIIKNKIILEIYNGYTKYGLTTTDEVVDISATQRYKAIGNGWTVDVIAHIFSFLEV